MAATDDSVQETDTESTEYSWFDDLKRRKVFRVVAAYAVVAWLILQIVALLSEAFPLPDWTVAATTIVLIAGFPIAAALSWIFQVTPGGIVLDLSEARAISKNRSRFIHLLDVTIICVLLIVVAYLSFGDLLEGTQSDIRVAVLPFENLGSDEGDAYLSEGLADDIRSRLYEVPQLLVAARSSSRSLFNMGFDVRTLGSRLGVEHVLEGTLLREDDQIRVNIQLIDVDTGFSRWSKSYSTRFVDVLEMQNNISLVVTSELEVLLSKDVRASLARNPTEDPVAYDLYLQAKEYLFRPRSDENLDKAAALFRQALEHDQRFSLGYAGLCRTYIAKYMHSSTTEFVATAQPNCDQALVLDAEQAGVHTALGEMYLHMGQLDDAERAFRTAINLDSRAIDAQSGMGDVFSRRGDDVEAEARYRAAIETLPANWTGYNKLALFLLQRGRYEESAQNYQRVVDLTPDNAHGYNNLGASYYMLGDFAEAAKHFRASLEISPGRAAYSNTGSMYYYAGNFEEAAAMFESAAEEAESDYRIWGNLADALRFIDGQEDKVVASYEHALSLASELLEVSGADSGVYTNMAWYSANLGNRDAADRYLARAAEGNPRDGEEFYIEALTQRILGRPKESKTAILTAVERGFPRVILDATPELIGNEPSQ